MKPSILHLSYDLRDPHGLPKTTAIKNLIENTSKYFHNFTIDLVKTKNWNLEKIYLSNKKHLEIDTFGFPLGLLFINHLIKNYKKILRANLNYSLKIDSYSIIHAHKLTYEGFLAYKISLFFDVPFVVTLRQTDFYVLKKRPDLVKTNMEILKHAKKIFYLLPSMLPFLEKLFGMEFYFKFIKPKLVLLPNMILNFKSINILNNSIKNNVLVTILRLDRLSVKRKNLKNLFKSLQQSDLKLLIIGDGDYADIVKNWVKKYKLNRQITFLGKIKNEDIGKYLMKARAFVLPSFSESFGMVYAEALLYGLPILYSKGVLGFDGFFKNVGIGVNPHNVSSIAMGLKDIINNNEIYRKNITQLRNSDEFDIFLPENIIEKYKLSLHEVIIR